MLNRKRGETSSPRAARLVTENSLAYLSTEAPVLEGLHKHKANTGKQNYEAAVHVEIRQAHRIVLSRSLAKPLPPAPPSVSATPLPTLAINGSASINSSKPRRLSSRCEADARAFANSLKSSCEDNNVILLIRAAATVSSMLPDIDQRIECLRAVFGVRNVSVIPKIKATLTMRSLALELQNNKFDTVTDYVNSLDLLDHSDRALVRIGAYFGQKFLDLEIACGYEGISVLAGLSFWQFRNLHKKAHEKVNQLVQHPEFVLVMVVAQRLSSFIRNSKLGGPNPAIQSLDFA